jgi:hypothetical protein
VVGWTGHPVYPIYVWDGPYDVWDDICMGRNISTLNFDMEILAGQQARDKEIQTMVDFPRNEFGHGKTGFGHLLVEE